MEVNVLLYDQYDTEKEYPVEGILHNDKDGAVVVTALGTTKSLLHWGLDGWVMKYADDED
jgi:hypothetical protein